MVYMLVLRRPRYFSTDAFFDEPADAHTLVSVERLVSWEKCAEWTDFTSPVRLVD